MSFSKIVHSFQHLNVSHILLVSLLMFNCIRGKINTVPLFLQFSFETIKNSCIKKNDKNVSYTILINYFQKHGSKTEYNNNMENMSSLIFGLPSFQLHKAFTNPPRDPLLFITFSPQYKIKTDGVIVDIQIQKKMTPSLALFAEAQIDYSAIKTRLKKTPSDECTIETVTKNDLFQFQTTQEGDDLFAFRFDALSHLPLATTALAKKTPFVSFFDETFLENGISMRGLLVTDSPTAKTPIVIINADPFSSFLQFSYSNNNFLSLPILNNNGISPIGTISRFGKAVDYTPLAQNKLLQTFWIIPRIEGDTIIENGKKIANAVKEILPSLSESPTAILNTFGASLAEKNNQGIGGCFLKTGLTITISEHYIQSLYTLLHFPLEKNSPKGNILKNSLYNNGHSCIGLGTKIIVPTKHVTISSDSGYYYTIGKIDNEMMPIKGSTILIGPVIHVYQSWNTFYSKNTLTCQAVWNNIITSASLDYTLYHKTQYEGHIRNKFSSEQAQFDIAFFKKFQHTTTHLVGCSFLIEHNNTLFDFYTTISGMFTVKGKNIIHESGWSITCGAYI